MFERIGCSVKYLKRVEFAGLNVDDLPIGQYRELTSQELEMLLNIK